MLCTGRQLLRRVCTRAVYTGALSSVLGGQPGKTLVAHAPCRDKHTVEGGSASEQVLQYWQDGLLRRQCNHRKAGTLDVWREEGASVKELLNMAVRLRQGKVAAVLPEEVGHSLLCCSIFSYQCKRPACLLLHKTSSRAQKLCWIFARCSHS